MKRSLLMTVLGIGAITLIPALVLATDGPPGPGRRGQGPPPEAVTACEGKNVGDEVEFVTPHGHTISGTCEERNGLLFVIPEGGPPPRNERGQ